LVENAFARLKHYRAVALRFDKRKRNYESVVATVTLRGLDIHLSVKSLPRQV